MNINNKVRLIDFLQCMNPDDRVIINLSRNGMFTMTLYEDTVEQSSSDPILNESYCDLIVIHFRYSTLESRYWIKVRRDCDE